MEITKDSYQIQAIGETLDKTNLGTRKEQDELNLETSLTLQKELGGHLVQGHIDGVGEVVNYNQSDEYWVLRIKPPQELMKFIPYKGGIAVNGVSLTISKSNQDTFEVSLIKHTLENTNLKDLAIGDLVNLEIDVIARYLEKLNN